MINFQLELYRNATSERLGTWRLCIVGRHTIATISHLGVSTRVLRQTEQVICRDIEADLLETKTLDDLRVKRIANLRIVQTYE